MADYRAQTLAMIRAAGSEKGYGMAVAQKVKAILFVPLLLVAAVIDILIGDLVTGVEISWRGKLREHRSAWLCMWNRHSNCNVTGLSPEQEENYE